MNVVLIVMGILTGIIAWYASYIWIYDKINNITKTPISNIGNGVILVLAPIFTYITVTFLIIAKFLKFLDKE